LRYLLSRINSDSGEKEEENKIQIVTWVPSLMRKAGARCWAAAAAIVKVLEEGYVTWRLRSRMLAPNQSKVGSSFLPWSSDLMCTQLFALTLEYLFIAYFYLSNY
jgi:hypothetical protein